MLLGQTGAVWAEATDTASESPTPTPDPHTEYYAQAADTDSIEGWPEGPKIEAQSAVLMDLNTEAVLYSKNANTQLYPASITKLLTCLLGCENLDVNAQLTLSQQAAYGIEAGSSTIYGDAGEVFTVKQCLMALMLESANEMALGIGEEVSGSVKKFVELMNTRAQQLGCKNTHFNNPNGLPDETHVTTAGDMAKIAKAAWQNPLCRKFFTTEQSQQNSSKLQKEKEALQKAEEKISDLSDNLNEYSFSKEGVGIQDMVTEWLTACINEAKAKAEVKVLVDRQREIVDQYRDFSPVGTQIKRKERAVGIAEDNYRRQIAGLAEAHLRLQNIKMTTANLQVIASPEYPLTDNGRKRLIYILAAFFGSLIFISGYFLLIELLDRTLRDPDRSKRLSGLSVIAAFNGISNLKYRGFLKACNRLAAAYSCRQLNNYLHPDRPTVINLLSMEKREGKSFLAKYFIDYWETEGMKVRLVKYDHDFDTQNKGYVQAQELSDFWVLNEAEEIPDIILVEYPAVSTATLPMPVLKKADFNLLIANAARLWGRDDDTRLKPLKEELEGTPLFMYLNNADREVVESFTGELPPHTPVHSFFSRLAQLGLTSKSAAVK